MINCPKCNRDNVALSYSYCRDAIEFNDYNDYIKIYFYCRDCRTEFEVEYKFVATSINAED